jgi:hypothetical protein
VGPFVQFTDQRSGMSVNTSSTATPVRADRARASWRAWTLREAISGRPAGRPGVRRGRRGRQRPAVRPPC